MSGYWEAAAKAVGSWDLQEQSGLTAVDSVGSRDGSLLNGLDFSTSSTSGPTGWLTSALSFAGSNRGVQIPYDSALNGATYTTHAWAKWDGGGTPYGTVWSCRSNLPARSGHLLYKSTSDQWSHWFGEGGSGWSAYGTEPSSTDWVFLATTYDGTTSRIYLNGANVSSYGGSGFIANAVEPFLIGNRSDLTAAFSGDIAGFATYEEALSAADVAELYAGPEPTSTSAPSLLGAIAVGEPVTVSPGQWDDHGNGVANAQLTLHVSDDGVSNWSPVAPPIGDPGVPLPTSMAGRFLRVEAIATNAGGTSDPVVSTAYAVQASQSPVRLAAGSVRPNDAAARGIAARTSAAGLAVPMETV